MTGQSFLLTIDAPNRRKVWRFGLKVVRKFAKGQQNTDFDNL